MEGGHGLFETLPGIGRVAADDLDGDPAQLPFRDDAVANVVGREVGFLLLELHHENDAAELAADCIAMLAAQADSGSATVAETGSRLVSILRSWNFRPTAHSQRLRRR
jgi:hypothetical protein